MHKVQYCNVRVGTERKNKDERVDGDVHRVIMIYAR